MNEAFVDHGDERVGPFAPGVAVGGFFEDVGAFGECVAAVTDLDVHGEVGADVEGRVDVIEFEAALFFNLVPQRDVFEAGEDQLVVAPDELVGPALHLTPAGVEQSPASSSSTSDLPSMRGSSTCSMIWKGRTTLATS